MKGKNLEELLNKKVNIESFSGKKYEGKEGKKTRTRPNAYRTRPNAYISP